MRNRSYETPKVEVLSAEALAEAAGQVLCIDYNGTPPTRIIVK